MKFEPDARPAPDQGAENLAARPLPTYLAHGVALGGNVEFPEFGASTQTPEIVVWRETAPVGGADPLPQSALLRHAHYQTTAGAVADFGFYGLDGCYVARWHQLCDFRIQRDGRRIDCAPWPGVDWGDIRPFLLGRILPLALNFRGVLVLHSGGVLLPQGAIALVATPGTGKSTLAAQFACLGYPLVADDVLAVAEVNAAFTVSVGSSHVRLTEESLGFLQDSLPRGSAPTPDYDKSRVSFRDSRDPDAPVPLRGIYLLSRRPEREGEIKITTVPPQAALPLVLQNVSNRTLLQRPQLAQYFGVLCRLISQVPVKILEYPSALDQLPRLCQTLVQDSAVPAELTLDRPAH